MKKERRVTASRRVPRRVRPEQLRGSCTLPSGLNFHQSGKAPENHIPTHLKQRNEKEKKTDKTSELREDAQTKTKQSKTQQMNEGVDLAKEMVDK